MFWIFLDCHHFFRFLRSFSFGVKEVFDLCGFLHGSFGREPFAAVFPGRTEELVNSNPGIGVSCHDQFLIRPASIVEGFCRVRPGQLDEEAAEGPSVGIVEEFFLFEAACEDCRPLFNGYWGVPFRSNEFLDGLR